MMKFEALVRAINQAAVTANRALTEENIRLFKEQYFEQTDGGPALSSALEVALAQATELSAQDGVDTSAIEALIGQLQSAKEASDAADTGARPTTRGAMTPKTVELVFPTCTDEGVIDKTVSVPLIALVPVSTPEISELRMNTPLEVTEGENGLNVTFPSRPEGRQEQDGQEAPAHWTTLEIVVRPTVGPAALRTLVEGYEKVLRGQIP